MIREFFVWVRVFLSRRRDGELEEELRFHIEQSIEQKIAAGMIPIEARRKALIEFGGVERTREECVEKRPGWLLDSVWRTSRLRVAPSVMRTANSRSRAAPRAMKRLATFAHAINSTALTAPSRIQAAL